MLTEESECVTKLSRRQQNFTWKIDNFSSHIDVGDEIVSPIFPEIDLNDIRWRLTLRRNERQCYECLDIKLTFLPNEKIQSDLKAKASICLLNQDNDKITEQEGDVSIFKRSGSDFTFRSLYYRDEPKLNKHNCHNLTLRVKITFGSFCVNTFQSKAFENILMPKDFEPWLDNEELSDVTLVAEGIEFKAHKIMLAARSSAFAAMFRHNMQENLNNKVDIVDMKQEVLKDLLNFIYIGRVDIDNVTGELLAAADKYGLQQLKNICEDAFCKKLTVENVVEYLILADLHCCETLKSRSINFIVCRPEVLETENWENLLKSPQTCSLVNLVAKEQVKLFAGNK